MHGGVLKESFRIRLGPVALNRSVKFWCGGMLWFLEEVMNFGWLVIDLN